MSKIGVTVSCSWFADVILCSLVCSAEPNVFPGTDIIWVFLSGYFITIWLNQIVYRSVSENFPYFVIGSGAQDCVTVPSSLMEPVNPVFPGEGRWLDLTRTLQTTLQLSQKFFSAGRLHAFIVVAVFSLADVLFICGRVGTVERRSHESHQFNCGSTSNFCS